MGWLFTEKYRRRFEAKYEKLRVGFIKFETQNPSRDVEWITAYLSGFLRTPD